MTEIDDLVSLVSKESKEAALELSEKIKKKLQKNDKEFKKVEMEKNLKIEEYEKKMESKDKIINDLKSEDPEKSNVYKEENDNLKKEILDYKEKIALVEKEKNERILEKEIQLNTIESFSRNKVNDNMRKYLLSDIKGMTKIEDNQLKFINDDGTSIRRDGEDLTLDKYLKERRDQEILEGKSIFFDNSDKINKVGIDNSTNQRIKEDILSNADNDKPVFGSYLKSVR